MSHLLGMASIVLLASLCTLIVMALSADADSKPPRPEHPRPDRLRSDWLSLNGTWEFAEADTMPEGRMWPEAWPDHITVPFCRESPLSGLGRKGFVRNVWYRRTVRLPDTWKSARTLLHIGASDWHTRVWVNRQQVAEHVGGSAPVSGEITRVLLPGDNEIIIHVYDDTRSGLQALGKQCHELESMGCLYTRTTGIWQTVWLEGVGSSWIRDFHVRPDAPNGRFLIHTEIDGACDGLTVRAQALADGNPVGQAETPADWRSGQLVLPLQTRRLWSVTDPFLYTLRLELVDGAGRVVDSVESYAGLRSVSIRGAAILINDAPVFQRLVLDQGFYPDGIWTAPSEDALRRDIELSMQAGFNGARLHQKVFEPRFLYWADRLGYLVWGEYPNWGLNYSDPRIHLPVVSEWGEVVRRDRNHPSLIGWCPFNETPPEAVPLQNAVVNLTRQLDPARPVIDTSGWTHGLPDHEIMDAHDYEQDPARFRRRWTQDYLNQVQLPQRYGGGGGLAIPFFVSEYGGIGWDTGDGWGYGNAPKTLDELYARHQGLTDALLDNPMMFGFCYTQLTDVEQERNGIYTYDRKPKFDIGLIRANNQRPAAYESRPPLSVSRPLTWTVVLGSAVDERPANWRYTELRPAGDWMTPGYDDTAWAVGCAGFGDKPGAVIRTPWKTADIWLRTVCRGDVQAADRALLVTHYDNAAQVYVNGHLIWSAPDGAWNDRYEGFDVTDALKAAWTAGDNTVAVHVHQDGGGQYIDLALLLGR